MELLAGIGIAAKGLFDYNRENFKFDQDQRLEREQLRIKMQVTRFELFREDVRDLVSLTVDRMDVYHLVGALFLEFCVILFCEGRIQEARSPPFLLTLFLLSNACAFIYLMLAVWLSMHASIASHSFGARVLTRFLRLPIPSSQQIQNLSSRLAHFEYQDYNHLMRVPFQTSSQDWRAEHTGKDGPTTSSDPSQVHLWASPLLTPTADSQPLLEETNPFTGRQEESPTSPPFSPSMSISRVPSVISRTPSVVSRQPSVGPASPRHRPASPRRRPTMLEVPDGLPEQLGPPALDRQATTRSDFCGSPKASLRQPSTMSVSSEVHSPTGMRSMRTASTASETASRGGLRQTSPVEGRRRRVSIELAELPESPTGAGAPSPRRPSVPLAEVEDNEARRLLERGESHRGPSSIGEDFLLRSGIVPGRHILLFRHVQAKWQSYDAYCRVSMALGVNQILQGLSYYSICHTLIENESPSVGFALLFAFQGAALMLSILDISGVRRWAVVAVQGVGAIPAVLAFVNVWYEELVSKAHNAEAKGQVYSAAPFMFFLEACWFDLLLWMASPAKSDEAQLPRRFRAVLYMDVFGDAHDPTEAEHRSRLRSHGRLRLRRESLGPKLPITDPDDEVAEADNFALEIILAEKRLAAEEALQTTRLALRKWQAVPSSWLTAEQNEALKSLLKDVTLWRRALRTDQAWRAARRGMPHEEAMEGVDDDEVQGWGEMQHSRQDPFADVLLGPFEFDEGYEVSTYYYDTRTKECKKTPDKNSLVLSLEAVAAIARGFEAAVRLLLEMEEDLEEEEQAEGDEMEENFWKTYLQLVYDRLFWILDLFKVALMYLMQLMESARRCWRAVGRRLAPFFVQELPATSGAVTTTNFRAAMMRRRSVMFEAEIVAYPQPGDNQPPPTPAGAGDATPRMRRTSTFKSKLDREADHDAIVPARLPWIVLRSVTRLLQACWGLAGGLAVIDFDGQFGGESQLRRMREEVPLDWSLQPLEMSWPYGTFFRPRSLACLDKSALLIGSPFQSYLVKEGLSGRAAQWMPIAAASAEDAGAAALPFCLPPSLAPAPSFSLLGSSSRSSTGSQSSSEVLARCLYGHFDGRNLTLWRTPELSGQAIAVAQVQVSRPWQRITGALVSCDQLPDGIRPGIASSSTDHDGGPFAGACLLVAGWDGMKLPIAAAPLREVLESGDLASRDMVLRPRFDVPLRRSMAQIKELSFTNMPLCEVHSLQLDARTFRLWALVDCSDSSTTDIHVWYLQSAGASGRWALEPPSQVADFESVDICEVPLSNRLLIIGRGRVSGREHSQATQEAPVLLAAPIP